VIDRLLRNLLMALTCDGHVHKLLGNSRPRMQTMYGTSIHIEGIHVQIFEQMSEVTVGCSYVVLFPIARINDEA
jgi:hypothetical protein